MGRFRDAWRTLVQSRRDPYLRRSDIPDLLLQLAEQEEALASLYDKLNTVLSRWRKREQRERQQEPQEPPQLSLLQPTGRKALLRRRAAQLRGLPQLRDYKNGGQQPPQEDQEES